MDKAPEPEKPLRQRKILLLCLAGLLGLVTLGGLGLTGLYFAERQPDPDSTPPERLSSGERDHKQDLRNKYAQYREGRISAREMLDACDHKLKYTEKDKDALAEYIYALRSQVHLNERDGQSALDDATKAATMAPSPGRGVVALGDVFRALGWKALADKAYALALRNPEYVPDYTVEDPMDAGTLDALFSSDHDVAIDKKYENTVVRGKLIGVNFIEHGKPILYFHLSGCEYYMPCYLEEYNFPFKDKNHIESYVVELTQAVGIFFTMSSYRKFITVSGKIAYVSHTTFVFDCTLLKIEH